MLSAIIQARMNSSRLPGKIMKLINGKPLLYYLVDRLRYVIGIEQIIVATTVGPADNSVEDFCRNQGVHCHRGSEKDVLGRIYEASSCFMADPIMRLTADCPLIDTDALSYQIRFFREHQPDYCYLGLTFAEGICSDLFTFTSLEYAHRFATEKADREHVTPYLHRNDNQFQVIGLDNDTDDSKYRLVVDRPEDFEVVSEIIKKLYRGEGEPFNINKIKEFLDRHPEILSKNSSVRRNESYDVFHTE